MSLVKRANRFPFSLEDFFNTDWLGGVEQTNIPSYVTPAVNVIEGADEFRIELAAPGVYKEDFNIALDNDVLDISVDKVFTESDEVKENYTRKEFNYQNFKRSFNLPDSVLGTEISASYENGVLLIVLPKREEAKVQPKRVIEIK